MALTVLPARRHPLLRVSGLPGAQHDGVHAADPGGQGWPHDPPPLLQENTVRPVRARGGPRRGGIGQGGGGEER